jgi:hypothetical protein
MFVFAAELLVAAAQLPALPVTQYVLAAFALIMLIREVGDPPARSLVWQVVWPLGWSLISVLGFSQAPAVGYGISFTAFFWAFTIAEWRCAADARGRLPGGVLRRLEAYKRMFGRGSRVAGATALAGFGAVAGAFGVTVTIVHRATTPARSRGPAPAQPHIPALPLEVATTGATTGDAEQEPRIAPPRLECPLHVYRNAVWASAAVNALLAGGAGLGREEEGCVGHLDTRYASSDGFVFGRGLLGSGLVQSIVVDSEALGPPAIFIAPATGPAESLIRRYHSIGGVGRAFPRYRAGAGDYYLVNAANAGTCVLVRERSGGATEGPPYTVLYPAVAAAWLRIIELTGRWQWPTLVSDSNRQGEAVIELEAAGETRGDAEVTYDRRSLRARWNGYVYPPRQRQLSPLEVERLVREDLGSAPTHG